MQPIANAPADFFRWADTQKGEGKGDILKC